MNFATRSANTGDEPILREALYHALYVPPGTQPFPRNITDDPDIARYVDGWGRDGDMGVIAEVDGAFAGAAWLRLWRDDDRGYGFVDESTPELSIAVLPGFRGQGLGTRMLTELFAEADQFYPAISLSVSPGNPAQRLYERLGFVVVSSDADSILMCRDQS
jgi:ribosomal protein S18 acetylase RimI-like enzyme